MVEFICDDTEVEKALRKLHKQVTTNGGFVHDKLTIGCEKDDFKITAAGEVPMGEKVLELPKECLLPVDKYKLDLQDNEIVLKSHDSALSKQQVMMMETMIELYNLTGKIAAQKKISTFSLYYEDNNLLELILKSRSKKSISFLKAMEALDKKTFYLDSFIKTRVLNFKGSWKEAGGKEEDGKGFQKPQVLMPIIDFINHHSRATGFLVHTAKVSGPDIKQGDRHTHDSDAIAVAKSCPVEGSDECYVHYGPYDAMDALIHYNYAEKSAGFVRSVRLQIELPGGAGTIRIRSTMERLHHKKLPEPLKNLRFYIPDMAVNIEKEVVSLGFIYIPHNKAPHAMRRVLALAINCLSANLNQKQMMEAIRFAEKRIVDENLGYFKELSEYLKIYKPKPAVKLIAANAQVVAAIQLENINNYELIKTDAR